jgi:KUP system potassium uptake protein
MRALVWGVLGDIGTSPLYAMSETVSSHLMSTHGLKEKVTMTFGQYYGRDEVFGWTSLFYWAIAIVVSLKYVMLIMRADNRGEEGVFSILALLKARAAKLFTTRGMLVIVTMAVLGSGMILGDGVITPSRAINPAYALRYVFALTERGILEEEADAANVAEAASRQRNVE